MDPLMLSRLQFAAATLFHFIFVPLTLGLAVLIAFMETRYAWTGDKTYLKMVKPLFLAVINSSGTKKGCPAFVNCFYHFFFALNIQKSCLLPSK